MIYSSSGVARKRFAELKYLAVGVLSTAVLGTSLYGQDDDGGEVFVLSPFTVDSSQDVGYRVTNSTSGTSLNTAIKDVPMAIQVVTEEFIGDIGATDLDEALAFSAGVFTSELEASTSTNGADSNRGGGSNEKSVSSSSGGDRWANSVSIRGFNVPFQNRLGFRVGGIVVTSNTNIALGGTLDSVNIDRLEVVKGPNSLLYGIGVLSGIVNTIPKKPLSVDSYRVGVSAGSYGFLRATAEATGPLISDKNGHSLNYRFATAQEERGNYTDFATKELEYYALQFDYFYKDKANLFFEVQDSYTKYQGTGARWVYDDLGESFIPDFRNGYEEQYNYAREGAVLGQYVENSDGELVREGSGLAKIVSVETLNPRTGAKNVSLEYAEADPADRPDFVGGGLDEATYRITGGDTYDKRDEQNLLLSLDLTPTENLAFSLGAYYVEQETEELAVNALNVNNEGVYDIRAILKTVNSDGSDNEITPDMVYALPNDYYNDLNGLDSKDLNPQDDLKITRYWWTLRPESSESFQWRARATYNFDTPFFFGTRANHSFLVGYNRIEDTVKFLNGTERDSRAYNRNDQANDALYFRAIDDYTPFTFIDPDTNAPHNLAMPGREYLQQDIWFDGYYGVYHGRWMDEKIGVIAGIRYDKYNATTTKLNRLKDDEIGLDEDGYFDNPLNVIYSSDEPVDNFEEDLDQWSSTFALNYKFTDQLTAYALSAEGLSPNTGLTDGNNEFIPSESTRSLEVGIKFGTKDNKLTGSLAWYQIDRENAIWDFDYAPSPSKWIGTPSVPDGYSPGSADAFDPYPDPVNVLSYQIDSAEVDLPLAVAMATAVTTIDPDTGLKNFFGPSYVDPETGVSTRSEIPGALWYQRHRAGNQPEVNERFIISVDYDEMDTPFELGYVEDGEVVLADYTWRQFFEAAFAKTDLSETVSGQYDPIRYRREDSAFGQITGGNNPSTRKSDGANVTFKDKATGVDLELIYQPTGSLQFLFNYSHTEREAQGAFGMVNYQDLVTGDMFAGTEYSKVVQVFGREAFGIQEIDSDGDGFYDQFLHADGTEITQDNPLRPMDEAISGIDGVSLFFNPTDNATLWGRYDFLEGALKDLGVGFGAKYASSSKTSIPIGGSELGENLYPTPDTEAVLSLEMGLYYKFMTGKVNWRIALNVSNLLDDRKNLTTVNYVDNFTGRSLSKRTESFRTPRSYRLKATVDF